MGNGHSEREFTCTILLNPIILFHFRFGAGKASDWLRGGADMFTSLRLPEENISSHSNQIVDSFEDSNNMEDQVISALLQQYDTNMLLLTRPLRRRRVVKTDEWTQKKSVLWQAAG